MLRTTDGKLAIIDFGLMTEVTDDQKYGMVEAIAHLINRDYSEIGQDFINLDFIPKGTDTRPIVPALTKVFDVALAGGGAKSINFQELAADLAEITYEFPFRIPPYFALVIRAISVLEGIALVGNPNFAIIDEAYPYIARRLMTDKSPRLRAALRYMIYGKDGQFDVDNVIDLLQALEKFTSVKDDGDGSSFKVNGIRGNKNLGSAGDFVGSQIVDISDRLEADERFRVNNPGGSIVQSSSSSTTSTTTTTDGAIVQTTNDERTTREALRFFFDPVEGEVFRQFMLEEIVTVVDASSRQTIQELVKSIGLSNVPVPSFIQAMNPTITKSERRMVSQISQLVQFLIGDSSKTSISSTTTTLFTTERAQKLIPIIREYAPELRDFGILLVARLTEKFVSRGLAWATVQLQEADTGRLLSSSSGTTRTSSRRNFGIIPRIQQSTTTSSSKQNRSFIR
jgi:aarF domain-containing kinase